MTNSYEVVLSQMIEMKTDTTLITQRVDLRFPKKALTFVISRSRT